MKTLFFFAAAQLALGFYTLTLHLYCWLRADSKLNALHTQGKGLEQDDWEMLEGIYEDGSIDDVPEEYRVESTDEVYDDGHGYNLEASIRKYAHALIKIRREQREASKEEMRSNDIWAGAISATLDSPSDYDAPTDDTEISPAGRTAPPKSMTANG